MSKGNKSTDRHAYYDFMNLKIKLIPEETKKSCARVASAKSITPTSSMHPTQQKIQHPIGIPPQPASSIPAEQNVLPA